VTRKPGKPRAAKRKIDRKNGQTDALAAWERELLRSRLRPVTVRKQATSVQVHNDLIKDAYAPAILHQLGSVVPYTKQYGPMRAAIDNPSR
jgi:hypothetical protein